ncbi:hypothetical protein [Sporosarcina sp.]|uniref:hypothetical protein n=1 Tax=Sporosarcina sp. TaxID=49982 RepID=UPI002623ABDE|nr:hypothetical protein [Sporosarcina sp.]
MSNLQKKWTWREIVKGKKIQLSIWTLIFTVIFIKMAENGYSNMMNAKNTSIFQYNYSLGNIGLLFVIPAAILSVWTVKLWLFAKGHVLSNPTVNRALASRQLTKDGEVYKGLRLFGIVVVKLYVGIRKVLSVMGTVLLYIAFFIGAFSSGGRSGGYSSGYGGGGGGGGTSSPGSSNRKKLKKDADWEARQKQGKADHAWRHAGKQARYNVNTHHFDSRLNKANTLQREANEAAKRARNL